MNEKGARREQGERQSKMYQDLLNPPEEMDEDCLAKVAEKQCLDTLA